MKDSCFVLFMRGLLIVFPNYYFRKDGIHGGTFYDFAFRERERETESNSTKFFSTFTCLNDLSKS